MNSSIKVSVIMPIYNAQEHLRECLDSVISQTLKDIEIICVDDGSTDNTPNILNDYQQQDSRLKILHQQNLFAGTARNNGKAHATGKYLVFWDSDDYFYPTALEEMYEQCEKDEADLCVCASNQFFEDTQTERPAPGYLNEHFLPEEIPFNRDTHSSYILNFTTAHPWNKMFRRSFIEDQQLNFQTTRNGDDIFFVVCSICLAGSITVVRNPLIRYRRNQANSLTGAVNQSPLVSIQNWISAHDYLSDLHALPTQSFANKALGSVVAFLHMLSDWEAFRTCYVFLQEEGLKKLSITPQAEGYYYTSIHEECLRHMQTDSPEQFLAFFSVLSYRQHTLSTASRRDLVQKNEILREKNGHIKGIVQKLRKQVETLRNRVESLTTTTQKLRKREESLNQEIDQLHQKLCTLREQKASLQEKNQTLRNQLQTVRSQRDILRTQNSSLSDQLKLQKQNNKVLRNKLSEISSSLSYRIGRFVTYLPRKAKEFAKKFQK